MLSIEFTAGCIAIISTIIGATYQIVKIALKIRDSIDNFKKMVAMQDRSLLIEINKQQDKILSLQSEVNSIKNQLESLCESSNPKSPKP